MFDMIDATGSGYKNDPRMRNVEAEMIRSHERIPKVGIIHSNYNLVSKDKRPNDTGQIWQHECDDWYVYSNISNSTKVNDLKQISKFYHLNLKIEEIKPKNIASLIIGWARCRLHERYPVCQLQEIVVRPGIEFARV